MDTAVHVLTSPGPPPPSSPLNGETSNQNMSVTVSRLPHNAGVISPQWRPNPLAILRKAFLIILRSVAAAAAAATNVVVAVSLPDNLRELPDMMSAKLLDYLTPSPCPHLDLIYIYYKIHATSLTTYAFP